MLLKTNEKVAELHAPRLVSIILLHSFFNLYSSVANCQEHACLLEKLKSHSISVHGSKAATKFVFPQCSFTVQLLAVLFGINTQGLFIGV